MIYLLDVNALIAAGYAQHLFHSRMAAWIERDHPEVATTIPKERYVSEDNTTPGAVADGSA